MNCPRCGWSVFETVNCPRDWGKPGAPIRVKPSKPEPAHQGEEGA